MSSHGLRAGLRAVLLGAACAGAALLGLAAGPGCACDNTHWDLLAGNYLVDGWYAREDAAESVAITGTLSVGERGDTIALTYSPEDGSSWVVRLAED